MTTNDPQRRPQPDDYEGYYRQQQQPGYGQQPPYQPPPQQYGAQPPRPPKKRHLTRNILLGIGGVIVLIVVIAVATSSGSSPSSNNTGAATGAGSGNQNAPVAASSAPSPSPSPTGPVYTVSQQQAIDAAKEYLTDEPGFSYLGLIGQLDSSAGGFSQADATVGVNAVAPASDTAFWNAQAVDSAKQYMQDEPGWSACSLVQQLDSGAVQFTQAQAEYAAQAVGLGSC